MIERFRQEEIMSKVFNTTAVCIPEEHYMVNIAQRLQEIKALVDDGKYFTINKARQYGKTTTLIALKRLLESEYDVVCMRRYTERNKRLACQSANRIVSKV